MRLIVSLVLLLSVFLDFSASSIVEDFSICHRDDASILDFQHDLSQAANDLPIHPHTKSSETHHCHAGHTHIAVNFSFNSLVSLSSLNFLLEFSDFSLALPSPSLSEINRPPIRA